MLPGRQIETRTAAAASCLLPACVALFVTLVAAQSPDEALLEAERHRRDGDFGAALSVLDSAASEFPDQPLIHFNRGALLAERGRYEEAEAALMAGLALEPRNPDARLTLAKVLVQSHRHEEALAHVDQYAAAVGEPSQGFDVHYVRGLALRRLDRLAESERELRRATALNPGHADALFNLGAVLDQQGSHGEAEDYLRKAAGLQPGNADFRYRLAGVLKKNGKVGAAAAQLDLFRDLRERTQRERRASVLMRRAEASLQAGDPVAAKELYQQAIRLDPRHAEAHLNLGVAYERLGRGALAEAMFRKALEIRRDYSDAHLNLGLKLAEKAQFASALESVREAVRLAPTNPGARKALAMVLTRLKRPQEAVPHFELLVQRDPASVEARIDLGIALAEAGQRERALAAFDEAVGLGPKSFRPHYNRGRALNDLGRTREARQALETAIGLNSQFAPALHLLGTIERAAGQPERAVELLLRAAQLDGSNALLRHDLGLAADQAGRAGEAIRHWEAALAIDPSHREAMYSLAQALQGVDEERARRYREGFAALTAERHDTDRAGTLWNFALAEANRERWESAFQLFRRALDACGHCPARGQIHKNFGLVYGHSGDFASALDELLKARRLLPDDRDVETALETVRSKAAR
ncbi:MAG: tetratricopeptide repeat protein [Bryobacterales bacterium]|nr:tetratricopeptide repeat protein [Bryobacterales bacterium]